MYTAMPDEKDRERYINLYISELKRKYAVYNDTNVMR
jgi:hypothetical protein